MRHRTTSVSRAAVSLAAAAAVASAAPDTDALIERLARTPPANVAFVEVRFSTLLAKPLVVSGTLEYQGPGGLQRRVEAPYGEHTTIRGETVTIERDGESARTVSLRRAPELRGLLMGMTGLLAGDSAFVADHFTVAATGDDQEWSLTLEPVDDRLRQRLRGIAVAGHGAEPDCFAIRDDRDGASVMLLGAFAARPLPQPLALPELLHHCGLR